MAKTTKKKAAGHSGDYAQDVLNGILDVVGEESAQLLGSDGLAIKIKGVISTQSATIDAAIGRGGIPKGRLTILHGAEGSGKTTLALHIAAETQRIGGVVVYLDKEYKLDPDYAANIGVNTGRLIIAQPDYLEKAFQMMNSIVDRSVALRKKGKEIPILVVLDSMNAAITKAQFEGDWDAKHMAPQARVFSELLPKLMPRISKENVALLFISQIRKKMNVQFGNDESTAGGSSPRFYASLMLDIGRRAATNVDGQKIGNAIEVCCKKNQIAPPFRKAPCDIIYGEGIDKVGSILDQAVIDGFINKEGAYFSYENTRIGHGKLKAVLTLKKNPKTLKKILEKIEKKHGWQR